MDNYELYHHGIKGQKWGVRRTAAQLGHWAARKIVEGSKKTGKAAGKKVSDKKKAIIAKAKQDIREQKEKNYYRKLKKKKISEMTDKEVKDLTDRIKREASLKDANYESRMQNARKFYKTVAEKPVNTFTATYTKKALDKAFGTSDNN